MSATSCFSNFNAQVIHGDIGQNSRQNTIREFKEGNVEVLVATDVAARGLDIAGVDLVVHTSPPGDSDSFVHRSGRTGRAGRKGTSITFFTEKDLPNVRGIANVIKQSGCFVEDWMMSIKPLSTKAKRKIKKHGVERSDNVTRKNINKYDSKKKNMIEQSKKSKKGGDLI